ncbi:MAG: type II toxin-antitoxin system HicB family antitoxin [Candidatus Micrarchaeota archaeon]|nr:type II toxin-antitoxin system HicB family antitoxin [Candidatus Micrarchaeota archaeon]
MAIEALFPVVLAREGKWHIAICPTLDIATQGKTEKEARKMIVELIKEYIADPDTPMPNLKNITSVSFTNVAVKLPRGVSHRKAQALATA